MKKGRKQSKIQMKFAREKECDYSDDLFAMERYPYGIKNEKVNSKCLSLCKQEPNQTTKHRNHFKETARRTSK
jgi:hypothetical protein